MVCLHKKSMSLINERYLNNASTLSVLKNLQNIGNEHQLLIVLGIWVHVFILYSGVHKFYLQSEGRASCPVRPSFPCPGLRPADADTGRSTWKAMSVFLRCIYQRTTTIRICSLVTKNKWLL